MRTYDVIVIGGGVVGVSIARELSRCKLSVGLLEKEEELAFGVSKSNSGIIHPGTQNPPGSLKARLCIQGNLLTRKMAKELGIDLKEVGELMVAFKEDEVAEMRRIKKEGDELGVERLEIVGREWLREREPNLSHEVMAALYAPTAAIISPYRWVYDISENAVKNGVEIHTCQEVKKIERSNGVFVISTHNDVFKAKYVVNAAGLFADEVARMVGLNDFNIRPRKGEEFLLDKKKENITNHLIFPLPDKNSKGVIVIKTSDGNPMIGPTAEDVDDKEDFSTTEEGLKKVFSLAQRMVPSVNENDIIAYFAGLRPVVGDDFIIRHEDKIPGFVNVAGIQSPGLTAAPAIAVMVSGILKEHGLQFRKKFFFHGHREKEVHLFSIPLAETEKLIKKDKAYGDIVCRCEMVSAKEIDGAISRGAKTLDGIKFRTRAQSGRCHGGFCTTRILKMLSQERDVTLTAVTKRGPGSEIVMKDRHDG